MAFTYYDRVKETTATTGTGNITLAGAVAGFVAFQSVFATNDRFYYCIQEQSGSDWEVGIGQLTSSTTLVRTQVIASSNSNTAVSFSSGTKDVFVSIAAAEPNGLAGMLFGNGIDGDLTISSGTTSLTRDMYYRKITISGTASINPQGFKIFCSELLDLSNAPANAIAQNGASGNAGIAAGTAQSGATITFSVGSLGIGGNGSNSGAGGTTTGTQANNVSLINPGNGGSSGKGGTGGNGSSGNGGTSRAGASNSPFPIYTFTHSCLKGTTLIGGGQGAPGGSGGGGDGTSGASGGGGSSGGGIVFIIARTISRGGSTAASCISAVGGSGAAGGSASTGNRGGGGGAGGGGGGWIFLLYALLTGSSASNALDASSGAGGLGGNATGTGTGGTGGDSGMAGRLTICNMGNNSISESIGSSTNTGSGPSGTTGGSGGAVKTLQANL